MPALLGVRHPRARGEVELNAPFRLAPEQEPIAHLVLVRHLVRIVRFVIVVSVHPPVVVGDEQVRTFVVRPEIFLACRQFLRVEVRKLFVEVRALLVVKEREEPAALLLAGLAPREPGREIRVRVGPANLPAIRYRVERVLFLHVQREQPFRIAGLPKERRHEGLLVAVEEREEPVAFILLVASVEHRDEKFIVVVVERHRPAVVAGLPEERSDELIRIVVVEREHPRRLVFAVRGRVCAGESAQDAALGSIVVLIA